MSKTISTQLHKKTVAIIGAGPAGLMVADYLCQFDVTVEVYEQMPTAARKFLMAGKTGLNISHAEDIEQFVKRYRPHDWLEPYIRKYPATWIQNWMLSLGIQSYTGSSGRIFPVEMKAAPLLRAWLTHLQQHGVQFFYKHRCENIEQNTAYFTLHKAEQSLSFQKAFDAIVLACGGISWQRLGSDGKWQDWLNSDEITPFYPSNVGVECAWSPFMQSHFGQALKRVKAWVTPYSSQQTTFHQGDIIISHYGLESGLIYRLNHALYEQQRTGSMQLCLDLLPDLTEQDILKKLHSKSKQSLNNLWRKAGLDSTKIALLREVAPKSDWTNAEKIVQYIKCLVLPLTGFRPIQEAISSAGGVRLSALNKKLQLNSNPYIYCCGEMLDWDAPTGGYLLTACFATGRWVGESIHQNLCLTQKHSLS